MAETFDITRQKETAYFEAKLAKGGLPNSLWESYSAFANTDGGTIALGVKERADKTLEPVGVDDPEKLVKTVWDVVNDRGKVSLNILSNRDVSVEVVAGRKIVLIRVPRAERYDRPIFINRDIQGGVFRRNGEGDYKCSGEEIRAMLRDAEGKSQDLNVVDWAAPSVLDAESVRRYRNRMRICRPGHVWLGLEDDVFLLRLGATGYDKEGVLRPTRAGLLMFGNEYDIVREFPQFFLDYRERFDADTRWTDRIYSSSGDWTGNVHDFYFRVYNRIAQTLRTPFKMVGGDRVDDTPVHKAIREALANCLVNADYYLPRGVVVIRDAESLSLANPGGFRVPVATAMSGGVSDPRNATILKMFNLIDVGERTGSGIPLIRETWKNQTWPDVKVTETFNPERTVFELSLQYGKDEKLPIGGKKLPIGSERLPIDGKKLPIGSERLPIDGKKLPIEDPKLPVIAKKQLFVKSVEQLNLTRTTSANIIELWGKIPAGEIFGRKHAVEILGLSARAAGNLLSLMHKLGILESVKGFGKGRYRFVSLP